MFTRWDDFLRQLQSGADDVSAIIAAIEELLTDMYCRAHDANGRLAIEQYSRQFQAVLHLLKLCDITLVRNETMRLLGGEDHVHMVQDGEHDVVMSVTEWLRSLCTSTQNATLFRRVVLLETLAWNLDLE